MGPESDGFDDEWDDAEAIRLLERAEQKVQIEDGPPKTAGVAARARPQANVGMAQSKLCFTPSAHLGVQRQLEMYSASQIDAARMNELSDDEIDENEEPAHHEFDLDACQTWIYPETAQVRLYQKKIVHSALFTNTLVALPTGLGKTFIAAVVMLNWYRWCPHGKILFMAPTKPLLMQQQDACREIYGDHATAYIDGTVQGQRRKDLAQRRIIFATPQVVCKVLSNGLVDPRSVVCAVFDEAHRAMGNYAYVQAFRDIYKHNRFFRVLALTATPGVTRDSVNQVLKNLAIARVQFRRRESPDIRSYVQPAYEETFVVEPSADMRRVSRLMSAVVSRCFSKLKGAGALPMMDDPTKLTIFGLRMARQEFTSSARAQHDSDNTSWVYPFYAALVVMAGPMDYLQIHGIRTFNDCMTKIEQDIANRQLTSKLIAEMLHTAEYREMRDLLNGMVSDPTFLGHPKLDVMVDLLRDHFTVCEQEGIDTRVMVFVSIRQSALQIVNILNTLDERFKAQLFVGQSASAHGISGMKRQEQELVINRFKAGEINILVATSIGEEGLDIGEVDMVVSYDQSSSLIRNRQRVGRTGRKRSGRIYNLCLAGKESFKLRKALDAYKTLQLDLENEENVEVQHDMSRRIIPSYIRPQMVMQKIEKQIGTAPAAKMPKAKQKRKSVEAPSTADGSLSAICKGQADSFSQSVDPASYDDEHTGLLTNDQFSQLMRRFGCKDAGILSPSVSRLGNTTWTGLVPTSRRTKALLELCHDPERHQRALRLDLDFPKHRKRRIISDEDVPPPASPKRARTISRNSNNSGLETDYSDDLPELSSLSWTS